MADQSRARARARRAGCGGPVASFRQAVAAFFPHDAAVATIEPVLGGFSGSPVAKVTLSSGRCWAAKGLPEGIDASRGRWVHQLMRHLRAWPLPFVAGVAETTPGVTLWQDPSGILWEMLTWMPGSPRPDPTMAERAAGLRAVAALHMAAGRFPECPASVGVPAAVTERAQRCLQLLQRGWPAASGGQPGEQAAADECERLAWRRIDQAFSAATATLAADGGRALRRVISLRPAPTPLLPVMRDLTADHLLFADAGATKEGTLPDISGVIDFHPSRLDSPACDLARLVSSWHGGLPTAEQTHEAVASYADSVVHYGGRRPGVAGLCQLVDLLAATGVILGLDNWIRWLLVEQRRFPDWAAVATRVERHAAAVEQAFERLAAMPLGPFDRR